LAVYTYIAADAKGRRVGGYREVADRDDILNYLARKEYADYTAFESETRVSARPYRFVSVAELAAFCSAASVLLSSGIAPAETVFHVSAQTKNKQLKTALTEIYERMAEGLSFSEAFGMYGHVFTNATLVAVSAGQANDNLSSALAGLAGYFERESAIRAKKRSAVLYPGVMAAFSVVITFVLIIKILPMFEDILNSMGGGLPAASEAVYRVVSAIDASFLAIVIILVILAVGAFIFIRTERGRLAYDRFRLKAPIVKKISSIGLAARYSEGLALLIQNGAPLSSAIDEARFFVNNKYFDETAREAAKKSRQGEAFDITMSEFKLFPELFVQLSYTGHISGSLGAQMSKAAEIFGKALSAKLDKIYSLIEPIVVAVLSVVIGAILISVMLPLIGIMNSIS